MVSLDKETIKILLKETLGTKGWKIIEEMMNEDINKASTKLLNSTKPDDSIKIAQLQTSIKCYTTLLNRINQYVTD